MRVGMILPTFRERIDESINVLREIEDSGLDGAFVYDHLWPMFHRERPAISAYATLGALCAHRRSAVLGTLVARVGVVAPSVLVRELRTVYELSSGEFIAGLGTGDRKSAEELAGFGIEFTSADVRRAELAFVATELMGVGIPVWVGGGMRSTNAVAGELDATLNLWGATIDRVRVEVEQGPVSWAGRLPEDLGTAATLLADLATTGATWAVFEWRGSHVPLLRAMALAGLTGRP